jgi:hypothetical protein
VHEPTNSEMADFAESGDGGPGTVNHVPGDFGPMTLCQTLLKEPRIGDVIPE